MSTNLIEKYHDEGLLLDDLFDDLFAPNVLQTIKEKILTGIVEDKTSLNKNLSKIISQYSVFEAGQEQQNKANDQTSKAPKPGGKS